jgi:ubiquinol oxidase
MNSSIIAGSLLRQLRGHFLSSTAASGPTIFETSLIIRYGIRLGMLSTASAQSEAKSSNISSSGKKRVEQEVISYWGIEQNELMKEDGTEWKWTSFRVTELFFSYKYWHKNEPLRKQKVVKCRKNKLTYDIMRE